MIKGIAHLAFVVKEMEKSLDFYCEVLGFKKVFEIHDDDGNPWINYLKIKDGQFIELFYSNSDEKEIQIVKSSYSHLCLEVENIYEIAEHLKQKGITLDVEPVQGKDLNYQCWAKDPDGNRIEFMQMNPDSLQSRS